MIEMLQTEECLNSQTCCEGGGRPGVPFSQRNEVRQTRDFAEVIEHELESDSALREFVEAEQLIQERGEIYGPFDVNMYGTALQISGMLAQFYGRTDLPVLPAYMGAMIATAYKSNRIVKSPKHEDSHLDHGNYLRCAKEIA